MRVLDYCAGGGGKALAMAARAPMAIVAHDADPRRMADLPARAARAGAGIEIASRAELAAEPPFDLVLVRRALFRLGHLAAEPGCQVAADPGGLARLTALQDQIVDAARPHLRPGGRLAYMTCSLLADENDARVEARVDTAPGWYGSNAADAGCPGRTATVSSSRSFGWAPDLATIG